MSTKRSVKGIVQDTQGKPLADAIVMITGGTAPIQDTASSSNEHGAFYLDNLTLPGSYTIRINWQGATSEKTVNLGETDSVFTVRF